MLILFMPLCEIANIELTRITISVVMNPMTGVARLPNRKILTWLDSFCNLHALLHRRSLLTPRVNVLSSFSEYNAGSLCPDGNIHLHMYCLQVLVNLDVAKQFMISITNPSSFSKGTAFSTGIYVRQNLLLYIIAVKEPFLMFGCVFGLTT